MPAQAAICILFQLSLDRASQVAFINCYDLKFVEMLTRLFNSLRDEKFTYSSISKQFDSGVLRMEFPTTFLAPLKSHDHDIDDLEIATMQMKQVHPGSSNYLQGSWFTIIEKSVSTTNKSTYILDRYSNSMIDIIVDIQDICFDPAILTNLWSSILNYGIRLRKEKFIMVNELDKISPVSLFSTFASLQYEFEEVPPELVNFPGKKAARMYYKREFYIPKSDDLHDALFIIGAINTDLFEPRIAYEEFYGRNFHIIA
uniref:SERPIN domain-containing protein n=1 Tax=Rhabditophanes sp. KR3021 TaxID=114890 RepID=A0AC35U3W7_9BILA